MIKPTYVNCGQAKLLKQKGFDVPCGYKWGLTEHAENSNDVVIEGTVYSLYCHRDFGMYAIQIKNWNNELVYVGGEWVPLDAFSAPEQWVVVEWLKINHDIWLSVHLELCEGYEGYDFNFEFIHNSYKTHEKQEILYKELGETVYKSPQEAYSAAFDYILNNLI